MQELTYQTAIMASCRQASKQADRDSRYLEPYGQLTYREAVASFTGRVD
jgi:hypothetical protein